jgi:hypothetical protein
MTAVACRALAALCAAWIAGCAAPAPAPPPASPPASSHVAPIPDGAGPAPADWLSAISQNVAPLRRLRDGRWPLVLWDQPDPAALSNADLKMLLARGIVPHLRLDPSDIPAAARIAAAGGPVVIVEGRAGTWPYDLAGPPERWAHRFPEGADVPPAWRRAPVPTRIDGWRIAAERMRSILEQFRAAGVTVDAVWLDYEGEPSGASYAAALRSERARREVPQQALASEDAWFGYTRRLWMSLLSAYVAAPAREVFPAVSVTNWIAGLSSQQCPVVGWTGRAHPPQGRTEFTESNPVAYAIDRAYAAQSPHGVPAGQAQVDAFYTHVMLRQVSADACNRLRDAPQVGAVAWVARWVPDLDDASIPVMSRAAYREALRHLWLRGVDAMEVFNPRREGFLPMALAEVQDAAAVYDEMLAYRRFLEGGEVMNLEVPPAAGAGALWSGLRLGDEAVVRVVALGASPVRVRVAPWTGISLVLEADGSGRTFRVRREGDGAQAVVVEQ